MPNPESADDPAVQPNSPLISRIVCGTDGSERAQAAVQYCASLASQLTASVTFVHAVGLLEQLPGHIEEPSVRRRDAIGALLESDWSQPFRNQQVVHSCVMEDGPPLLVLPRVAARANADLIIVASHGMGNPVGLMLGSTAHGLVQVSPVPVLVVPARE